MSYLCFLSIILFLSCKKEDPFDYGNPADKKNPLLSRVIIDNQPYNEFIYTKSGLINEEKSNFDYKQHQYNDKDQIISTDFYSNNDILSSNPQIFETAITRKEWVIPGTDNKNGSIKYEYGDNNKLMRTAFSGPSSGSSESSEFSYDPNNRICRQTLYWKNVQIGYIDYSYDSKGNLIKESLFNIASGGSAELSSTTQYEFDNQQNPYRCFRGLVMPGIYTNRNNIVKETSTILPGTGEVTGKTEVISNSYEYNASGYPTSKNGNVVYLYK